MSTVRSHFRWHLADFPSKLQVVSFKEGVNGRGSFVRHKCIMKICNEIPFVVPDTVLEAAAQIFHVVELSSVFFFFFFSSTWLTWMGIKYLKLSSRLSKLYWTYWLNLQESKRVISQGLWLKKKKKKKIKKTNPSTVLQPLFSQAKLRGEKAFLGHSASGDDVITQFGHNTSRLQSLLRTTSCTANWANGCYS